MMMTVGRVLILISSLALVHCAHSARVGKDHWTDRELNNACFPLTREKREEILAIADPENFFGTRYRKGPKNKRRVEKETDCSSFVHEIYRRAGLPYRFRTTRELKKAPEFTAVPAKKALPGDLVLFRNHVGILGFDGKIVSATKTPSQDLDSSITAYPEETFGRVRAVLRYNCDEDELYARNNVTESRRSSRSQPR